MHEAGTTVLNSIVGNQFDTVIFQYALVDIANCGFDFCGKRLWYFQTAEFYMSLVSWWSAISLAQQGLTDSCFTSGHKLLGEKIQEFC